MELREVLSGMDSMDDEQWTAEGLPKLEYVSEQFGEKVSRKDIMDVAPQFTRANMEVLNSEESTDAEEEGVRQEEGEVNESNLRFLASRQPMTEREFAELMRKVASNELTAFESYLVDQLLEFERSISELEELRNRAKRSLAMVRSRIKREIPDLTNQQAIQSYIASQNASRKAKSEYTRDLLSKIDVRSLDPRAPIDRAMARKNVRGAQRPTR